MTSLLIEIAVLVVLFIALVVVIGDLPSPGPRRRRERRPAPARRRTDPRAIARVDLAHSDAADVHRVVRPMLREIAAARLAARRIAMDRDRERARALLGDELWEVVRPDRRPPVDPRGPGMSLRELTTLTEALEAL